MSVLPVKKFVLKYEFPNFSSMMEREKRYSPSEDHFGSPWSIKIQRSDSNFAAFLCCKKSKSSEHFQVFFEMKLIDVLGNEKARKTTFKIRDLKDGNDGYGWDFMDWEDVEERFSINGAIRMECRVQLTDIRRAGHRKFEDEEVADVVLVVEEKRFHVSKLFLAFQSDYFRSLLLGRFVESEKSEIPLKDVDSESFQFFLEVLHGESSITDSNIESLLRLADMYDTPTVCRRCEEFLLMFPTKIQLREKTRLAVEYRLENLKQKCLSEIKTISDIPDILSIPLRELDFRLAFKMLRKA